MEILNLYAGIGGNRKNWDGEKHNITAVEIDEDIAEVYKENFPEDEVIVADAHEYLKENYHKYDFIWASPPCPTHSELRNLVGVGDGQNDPIYPDMTLYQEIIFMIRVTRESGDFDGRYVIENVKPDYEPLIEAQERQRHLFWANFQLPPINMEKDDIKGSTVEALEKHHGFDLSGFEIEYTKKRKMLRNCTHAKIGEKILNSVNNKQQKNLVDAI